MKAKLNFKSILFASILAVAGFFGVSSAIISKQVSEEPVAEKAEATESTVWDGSMTEIRVYDDYNARTIKLSGTFTYKTGYGDDQRLEFLKSYYETSYNDWGSYQQDVNRYKVENANSVLLGRRPTSYGIGGYGTYLIPTWIQDVSEVAVIMDGHTLVCGSLSNLGQYCKSYGASDNPYGRIGSGVGKLVEFKDFCDIDSGARKQCTGYLGGAATPSDSVTITKYYLSSKGTVQNSTTETTHKYAIPPISTTPEITGYLQVSTSWYTGSTYAGATSTYTKPTIITDTSEIELVGKYVAGKYVFFTDNKDRSINRVYYEGPTLTNSFTGASNMSVFYKNSGEKWVYYGLVPEDTKKLAFNNGSTGGYNQTKDITGFTLDNTNGWYCTDADSGDQNKYWVGTWSITDDVTPLYAGETLYIYRTDAADDTDYAFYFFNKPDNSHGVDAWSSKAEKITDAGSAFNLGSGHEIYKVTVPSDQPIWAKYIVTRYSKTKTPSTNKWDGVTSQTPDLTANGTNSFGFNSTTSVVRDNRYNDTVIYSNIFGYHVMSKTDGVCDQDGVDTDKTELASRWNALKSEYNEYNSDIQYAIWNTTTTGPDSLSLGMKRYDYIALFKYPTLTGSGERQTDFVNRATSSNRAYNKSAIRSFSPFNLINGDDENNLSTVIILVASSVALLSVTALSILVIKKRKNKEE